MRQFYLLVFLFVFTNTVLGQTVQYSSQDKKALKYYAEAAALLKRVQFREAIPPLTNAVDRDPNFIEAWLGLASAYNRLNQLDTSIYFYKRALEIDPDYKRSKGAYYKIGTSHYQKGEYQQAKEFLNQYLDRVPGHPKNEKASNRILADCQFAIEAIANPGAFNVTNLGPNANFFQMQYFPVLSVDQKQLFFTRREGYAIQQDEDIFYTIKDDKGEWSVPKSVSSNINTHFNDGACALSADGRTLVFTSCSGRQGYGSCDLYISKKEGDSWSKPQNMGRNINSEAWEAQPSLSADGRSIYFVSNRRGGFGGRDIWFAKMDRKGEWQPAENIGNDINTKKDEISPFIHANEEAIYFSSNGYVGMGGFDLYFTEKGDSTWTKPRNMGYPLNDFHDQISMYISSEGDKGYYAIEKRGRETSIQLYSFDVPEYLRVRKKSTYFTGTVVDAKTKVPLSADLKVYKLDNKKYYSSAKSDIKTGEYVVVLTEGNNYGIYVTKPGYLFQDFSFKYQDIASFDHNLLDIELQPIEVGAETVLGNIFFDFDDFELKKESESELRIVYNFMRKNRDVIVEISGHTDNKGNATYNQELSEKRAKTVYDFLVSKGISASRLTYKGYGQTRPRVTNDNSENQALNRRIEFKIVKIVG